MMKRLLINLIATLLIIASSITLAQTGMRPVENAVLDVQVELQAFQSPSPLIINGKTYLTYEIFATNVGLTPVTLKSLTVVNTKNPKEILFNFKGETLNNLLHSFRLAKNQTGKPITFQPGTRKIIYLMLEFKSGYDLPNALTNELEFQPEEGKKTPVTITMPPLSVNENTPIAVGAPLQGDKWAALNGPSNTSTHRRAYFVVNGVMYFSERFAIDFMQLGPNNMLYHSDPSKNSNYYSYGANIYAVADGKIVAIKNNLRDNIPEQRNVDINLENVGGNFVLIDIGYNRYAYYAHFIPGSITVKPGDKVKKGQLLGKLGNSGNSSAPHLHFHIVDGPSDLAASGVPYAFEKFTTSNISKIDPKQGAIETSNQTQPHINELVKENDVINFPKQ